ncbi:MAG: hypothetical protein ACTSYL_02250 [Candidatus Thorarchaeota archaeon]
MIQKEWLATGVNLITFPVSLDYSVFHEILSEIGPDAVVVIHSKSLSWLSEEETPILLDATGHAITPASSLRRRLADTEGVHRVEDPADIRALLSEIRRFTKTAKKTYWVWWTASDLLAHGLHDIDIAKCLRVLNTEFRTPFVALVARDVHTEEGINLMGLVSMVWIDVTAEPEGQRHTWRVVKHFRYELEGEVITNE